MVLVMGGEVRMSNKANLFPYVPLLHYFLISTFKIDLSLYVVKKFICSDLLILL